MFKYGPLCFLFPCSRSSCLGLKHEGLSFFPADGRAEGRKAATPTFHRDEEKVNHHLINVGDWDVRPARLIGRPGSQCANQPVSASSAAAPSICVSSSILVSIGL